MDNSSGFTIRNYLDTRAKAAVKDLAARRSNNKKAAAEPVTEDIENPELIERLRTWRKRCATRDGVPAYVIMQQIALVTVCRVLPRSEKELSDIKGIGKVFMAKYGPQVLSIVRDWLDGKTEGETDCFGLFIRRFVLSGVPRWVWAGAPSFRLQFSDLSVFPTKYPPGVDRRNRGMHQPVGIGHNISERNLCGSGTVHLSQIRQRT